MFPCGWETGFVTVRPCAHGGKMRVGPHCDRTNVSVRPRHALMGGGDESGGKSRPQRRGPDLNFCIGSEERWWREKRSSLAGSRTPIAGLKGLYHDR